VRIDDDNITGLGDVDRLERRRQIGGKGLDCDCRAHEAYSIEERPHVRGHRVKSSHAIRDSARDRVIREQVPETLHDLCGRPFKRFIDHGTPRFSCVVAE
jgi:hypothetical protein